MLQEKQEMTRERSIVESFTLESLESRDRSVFFEMDGIKMELEEAAVREAMLQCEFAEENSEKDL